MSQDIMRSIDLLRRQWRGEPEVVAVAVTEVADLVEAIDLVEVLELEAVVFSVP